jgi:protein-S-isoprenylcysteine O-methyltransferase Ste14
MSALRTSILVVWGLFWIYWLISAFWAKEGTGSSRYRPPGLIIIVVVFILARLFGNGTLAIHSLALQIVGAVVFLAGVALSVWARIYLGRNWGMPMTEKAEPELVTSGPYHFVRHPIYSGLLLAILGTALATNLYYLITLAVVGAYFIYSAIVEEKLMTSNFPTQYPSYKAHTKMLIPFVL